MDYGWSNPFACYDVMIDPEDNFYIWREYQVSEKTTFEHANLLISALTILPITMSIGEQAIPVARIKLTQWRYSQMFSFTAMILARAMPMNHGLSVSSM